MRHAFESTRCWPTPAILCATGVITISPVILSLEPALASHRLGRDRPMAGRPAASSSPTTRRTGMSRLDWILETGATYVLGVPTHAMDILAEQKRRGLPADGKVQIFYMAGAPNPEVVAKAFVDQGITPQNIYGMTECSSHQYTHPDDPTDVWISTCGRGGRPMRSRSGIPRTLTASCHRARPARSVGAARP